MANAQPVFTTYPAAKNSLRQFVFRRALKSTTILGIILSLYMLSKASSYLKAYPTEAARQKLAETLTSNVGIEALLGVAHHIERVSGYVVWNFLCLITAVGAVWALLLVTKTLRGEEDSGRWELFLAGQTTARRALINTLVPLGSCLVVLYVLLVIGVIAVSRLN